MNALKVLSNVACLAALSLLPAGRARAQTDHVLQAVATLGSASARDDLLVPLAFTGPGLGLGSRYRLGFGTNAIEAELGLGLALLTNRFEHEAEQLSHGLAVGYSRVIAPNGGQRTELAAIVRWQDELTYFESWDDAHGYWLSSLVLAPAVRDSRALSSALVLESRAEVALLGISARPPERRWNKQDALTHFSYHVDRLGHGTRLATPLNLQSLRAEALLRFRRSAAPVGSGFGAGLTAAFSRSGDPEPYLLLQAGAIVTYGWEL
jgi:hypothetical protein